MNPLIRLPVYSLLLGLGLAACSETPSDRVETDSLQTTVSAARPELGSFGIDLSQQDPTTKPGDDFFRFANGKWLDEFELPADRSNYGSFSVLGDRSSTSLPAPNRQPAR